MDESRENAIAKANRLRCITSQNRTLVSLRIEDPDGVPLTRTVIRDAGDIRSIIMQAMFPGLVPSKEHVKNLPDDEEEYRLPISDECLLRSTFFAE
jgi:hypothetical protein